MGEASAAMAEMPMVQAREVVKRFGGTTVLDGLSLDVARGETVCIIGPSGSGKSTLLRCVNHLTRLDAGMLYVDGTLIGYERRGSRLYELGERDVCRQRADIGMVFQSFNLFGHMTALENVMEGPVQVRKEPRRPAEENARELLTRVGLGDKMRSRPRELSGGQQQRVAIARALAMRPKLMLFDEPTSALDPELVGEVLEVMSELSADGMTMIVVTHEIAFARDVSDRLVFIDAGLVVEEGPARKVLDDPQMPRTRAFLSRLNQW